MNITALVLIGLAILSVVYAFYCTYMGYSEAKYLPVEFISARRLEAIIFIIFGIFFLLLLSQIDKIKLG